MSVLAVAPEPAVSASGWRLPDRDSLRAYIAYAGVTAVLFVLGYGGANFLAAQRPEHLRLYWDAELAIPLLPWALWVYLSINLLFLLPLFRLDRDEMAWLGKRMIAGTLIAVAIFLTLPTTVGFTRLDIADGAHPAFGLLYALDQPFNCVPSLHVVYSALIMAAVGRHASTGLRLALGAWLLAIIASTLLTHQHHLIDAGSALLLVALLGVFKRKRA